VQRLRKQRRSFSIDIIHVQNGFCTTKSSTCKVSCGVFYGRLDGYAYPAGVTKFSLIDRADYKPISRPPRSKLV